MISVLAFPALAGIASSFTHCAAMCGPLQYAALSRSGKSGSLLLHAGRIIGYLILAAAFYTSSSYITKFFGAYRMSTGMLFAGVYILFGAGLFFDRLSALETAAAKIFTPRLSAVKKPSLLAAGILWGFLPCPVSWSVFLWTLSAPDLVTALAGVLIFAAGTSVFFALTYAASSLRFNFSRVMLQKVLSIYFVGFGIFAAVKTAQGADCPFCFK